MLQLSINFTRYYESYNFPNIDALAWLENFQQQVDQLKHLGCELNENLKIFSVFLSDSVELAKVEKVVYVRRI